MAEPDETLRDLIRIARRRGIPEATILQNISAHTYRRLCRCTPSTTDPGCPFHGPLTPTD